MLYYDYVWDLSPNRIIPDKELNTDNLGWKAGDYWKVVESPSGRMVLCKIDELEEFLIKGTVNGSS